MFVSLRYCIMYEFISNLYLFLSFNFTCVLIVKVSIRISNLILMFECTKFESSLKCVACAASIVPWLKCSFLFCTFYSSWVHRRYSSGFQNFFALSMELQAFSRLTSSILASYETMIESRIDKTQSEILSLFFWESFFLWNYLILEFRHELYIFIHTY